MSRQQICHQQLDQLLLRHPLLMLKMSLLVKFRQAPMKQEWASLPMLPTHPSLKPFPMSPPILPLSPMTLYQSLNLRSPQTAGKRVLFTWEVWMWLGTGIRVRIGTVIYLTDRNMSLHLEVKIIAELQMRNLTGYVHFIANICIFIISKTFRQKHFLLDSVKFWNKTDF